MRIFKRIIAILVSAIVLIGVNIAFAGSAEAATKVGFVNDTPWTITTSKGKIKPYHTLFGFNRKKDWYDAGKGSHNYYVSALGGGKRQTVCLKAHHRYTLKGVSDGAANQVVALRC